MPLFILKKSIINWGSTLLFFYKEKLSIDIHCTGWQVLESQSNTKENANNIYWNSFALQTYYIMATSWRVRVCYVLPLFFLLIVTHSKETKKPLPFMSDSSFSTRRSRVATECSSAFSNEMLWIRIKGLPSSSLYTI